ncbi:MAG: PilZ domain-containing protein [Candidatus Eisenbacteria bacterium]
MKQGSTVRPKARILGPGSIVTLEDLYDGSRFRMRVRERVEERLHVGPLEDASMAPQWHAGSVLQVRVARPFGLFCYRAMVEGVDEEGCGILKLDPEPPQRRQLRGYFRMQVRLGVHLIPQKKERDGEGETPAPASAPPLPAPPVILRACNLSGSGALLHDPDGLLPLNAVVRLGIPILAGGACLRLPARVVRVQESPRRSAVFFEGISENARQHLLRYLFREHRRRLRGKRGAVQAKITPLERP